MRHLAGGKLAVLRYTGRTGALVAVPVQATRDGDDIVVMCGDAANKQWWRHFRAGAPVEVLLEGAWRCGTGRVVTGTDSEAAAAYRRTYPRLTVELDAIFVVVALDGPALARPALRGPRLVRSWFLTVTAAEFLGFAVAACAGAVTADAAAGVSVPALLAAGALEGGMLGWGQVTVLRRALPGVGRRQWIVATAVAAMIAYAIGLVPSTLAGSIGSWPVALVVPGAVLLGAALLASIGTAQWLILRRHVTGALRWIGTTALAWLVGLGVFLGFAMPLWQPGQPLALTIAIGVGGGLLMAATSSLITGMALRHMLR
ncbi:hypothetical protein ACQP2Y_13985 [Actinoplanes sp. CA-051413]|uniref:hypothetical protein n=1 Tax=Actinoplanes sp. CA-051413 TaxID=3239899 RepID=UPI003D995F0D